MYEEIINELRRQAAASGGKFSADTVEPDTVRFEGVIDLRFLTGIIRDSLWEDLTRKLKLL